jgi:integrase
MRWEQIDWHNKSWRIPDSKNGEPITLPLSDKALAILESRLKASKGTPWVFASSASATGHLRDPKKAWERVRQQATIGLWMMETQFVPVIEEARQSLPPNCDIGQLFKRVCELAEKRKVSLPTGLMDIRLHDIRRTFGSYQAIAGASLPIIGKTLGHKSLQSTQVYARLHSDPIRASIDKATEAMFSLKSK